MTNKARLTPFSLMQIVKMRDAVIKTRQDHRRSIKTNESYSDSTDDCKLCLAGIEINQKYSARNNKCHYCPWTIFRNEICSYEYYDDSPASVLRLTNWLRTLNAEITRREKLDV